MEISSIEPVERTASQPASLRPAGCPERERTRRNKYRAPSAGVGCSDETCGSTNGACTKGYDAEGTSAHTARLKKDLLHFPRLEEPPAGHPRAVSGVPRPAPAGRICRRLQVRPVGMVPRHRGGRDRPGLSAHSHSAKTLWPIPGTGRGRAAGTTVYHPPSSYQRHHA